MPISVLNRRQLLALAGTATAAAFASRFTWADVSHAGHGAHAGHAGHGHAAGW